MVLKRSFLTLFILCLFSLVGCSDKQGKDNATSFTDSVKVDTDEIESLTTENQFLNERNQYLITTIKHVLENLSDEEMLKFSQEQVLYELEVNGEPIPKNGQIAVEPGIVNILLSEQVLGFDFLQAEWIEKGKISGDYINHLLNIDKTNWMLIELDGTVATARGYQSVDDTKSGQQFSFHISEELKNELEFDTTLIQIKVK